MQRLSIVEREQLLDKYTACELIDILDITVCEVINCFEQEITDMLEELLDESRGIGL